MWCVDLVGLAFTRGQRYTLHNNLASDIGDMQSFYYAREHYPGSGVEKHAKFDYAEVNNRPLLGSEMK
jgi:hypothetical protein